MPYDNSRLFPIFSSPFSPFHARKVTIMHFYLFPSFPPSPLHMPAHNWAKPQN